MENSTRKYITIGIAFVLIVGFIVASLMGKKQDQVFQMDNKQYNIVIQQLKEGNYKDALAESADLEKRHGRSDAVNYMIALAATNAGETEKSILYMQRALDNNPYKVEDPLFMLQLAEALILAEMLEEAAEVLERSKTLKAPESYPQYQERVTQLQEKISNSTKEG
ncbi:tetratricopeptide repeat protein [Sporosarcina sp. FSL K6-3457]|uniref:tetratricopeptide repeat protein n=1 Tax=Sporosarcina sp. FSL K6-3457 TaxID=2978204 RepID=UPI0030F86437